MFNRNVFSKKLRKIHSKTPVTESPLSKGAGSKRDFTANAFV